MCEKRDEDFSVFLSWVEEHGAMSEFERVRLYRVISAIEKEVSIIRGKLLEMEEKLNGTSN